MSKTGKFTELGCKTAEKEGTGRSRLMSKGLGNYKEKLQLSASELFTSLFCFFKTVSHYVAQNQLKI